TRITLGSDGLGMWLIKRLAGKKGFDVQACHAIGLLALPQQIWVQLDVRLRQSAGFLDSTRANQDRRIAVPGLSRELARLVIEREWLLQAKKSLDRPQARIGPFDKFFGTNEAEPIWCCPSC